MLNFTCIRLDASLKASLDWNKEVENAKSAIEQGSKILWKLDFGLFDQLQHPLGSQQQFQGLRLAIEHFQGEVLNQFAENSLGAVLYEGSLDFVQNLNFDNLRSWALERFENFTLSEMNEEDVFLRALFCRDVALDYLKQLASQMPFGVECFIQPQIVTEMSPIEQAIFLNEECYRPLHFLERSTDSTAGSGVCLPPITCYYPESHHQLDAAIYRLASDRVPYRFIAEEALITSIAGLDELYVAPLALSSQGKRKLQGFIATGGQVHYLSPSLFCDKDRS